MEAKKIETSSAKVPRERERMVELEFPVEHEGKKITAIRVKRVTVGEIQSHLAKSREAADEGKYLLPPVIDCSVEVWELLDQDDATAIEEAALDFFPRVLRESLEADASGETTGDQS